MKKLKLLLLFVSLSLYACGGGGGKENTPPPYIPPYQTMLTQEKTFTTNRWNQTEPASAYGDEVYLVAFVDDRENYNAIKGEDIWGVLLDSNLNILAEFPIVQRVGRDIDPLVVYNPNNKQFLVAWNAYGESNFVNIMSAFVSLDGKVTQNGILNVARGFAELKGLKKVNEGYAFLFKDTWLTYDINVGSKVLKVTLTDNKLNPLKTYTVTDEAHQGLRLDPLAGSIDCLDNNICLVVYNMAKEILRDNSLHIYARIVSLQDGLLTQEIKVTDDVYGKVASKTSPVVAAGKDNFIVAWKDFDSEQGTVSVDFVGKFVSLSGTMSQNILISDFRWDKNAPVKTGLNGSVASIAIKYKKSNDTFYAVWSDSRSGRPLETSIFMRRIGKDKDCIMINNMPLGQNSLHLTEGKDGKMFLSWTQSAVRKEHGHFSADIFGLYLPL